MTVLGYVVEALQGCMREKEMEEVIETLKEGLGEGRFFSKRNAMIDMLRFIGKTTEEVAVKENAFILATRLQNLRFGE